MKFIIGTSGSKSVKVDAMIMADTRVLINASSGLGKSWLMRLIAENVASSIQTILIDPEGEYPTLREKFDLLIVSENGDLRADIRSAGLLARKLAETGVSAVIDIYDLPGKEDPWVKRRMFVAEFLNELMNLPKKLYHPMLVMVDEAHQFAQEKPSGDYIIWNSQKVYPAVLSRSAIRSMMSAGRKRGIGGILATQRISKIDKDSIADARNVFIGGTTLDIDQQRAGDILGMSRAESVALRDLDPGTFFSFGPAIDGRGVVQFKSGKVQTTHPKAGQRSSIVVPAASTQISGIVEQFGDLPAIAEEEVKNAEVLKRENADLKRQMQLQARPTQVQTKTETRIERVEVPVLPSEQYDAIMKSLADLRTYAKDIKFIADTIEAYPLGLDVMMDQLKQAIQKWSQPKFNIGVKPGHGKDYTARVVIKASQGSETKDIVHFDNGALPEGEKKILARVAEYPGGVTAKQLTVLTGYKRSTRNTYLQRLSQKGAIKKHGDRIFITDIGRQLVSYMPLPSGADLHAYWLQELPQGERAIFEIVLAAYPEDVDREGIDAQTGYSRSTRNTYIQRMLAKEIIATTSPGRIKASDHLFE